MLDPYELKMIKIIEETNKTETTGHISNDILQNLYNEFDKSTKTKTYMEDKLKKLIDTGFVAGKYKTNLAGKVHNYVIKGLTYTGKRLAKYCA